MIRSKIAPLNGWVLVSRDEIDGERTGDWYIAWADQFSTKKEALAFAKSNNWPRPFRAERSKLSVLP